jgi:hypothetical protein
MMMVVMLKVVVNMGCKKIKSKKMAECSMMQHNSFSLKLFKKVKSKK